MVGRPRLPWGRRTEEAERAPAAEAPSAAPSRAASTAPPLPRESSVEHHWLTVTVARHAPAGFAPVPQARVVVRAFPRGAKEPGEPVGRGVAGADGTLSLLLPPGRYAIAASHAGASRVVTVTLEHAGRARVVLEDLSRRVTLTVETTRHDGAPLAGATVEVRVGETVVAMAGADESGTARLTLPPGAYEVRVGHVRVRTFVEADTALRVAAEPAPREGDASAPAASRYAQRVRAATQYVAPFDLEAVRDEGWN